MSSGLTLADILSRRVALEWHEGVAILRDTISSLVAASGQSQNVPEPHQIYLLPHGRIEVAGGKAVEAPVRRLGQLLQALLADSELPVQLRLNLAQAMAPESPFRSIREYGDALAYFERPQRDVLLRGVYERAIATTPLSEPKPSRTLDAIAPSSHSSRPAPSEPRPSMSSVRAYARPAAAIAAVLLLVAAVLTFSRYGSFALVKGSRLRSIAAQASDVVGTATLAGASAVSDRVGLGRIVTQATADAPPVPEAGVPALNKRPPPRVSVARRPEGHTIIVADLEPAGAVNEPSADAVPALAQGEVPSAQAADEPRGGETESAPTEVITYSAGSEGVSPAFAIRPPVPRELPASVRGEDLGRIEVIVSADGSVESVRLLAGPNSVHDAMFLSVVKAWQFEPARKDGVPVKYRKTIWIGFQ
jgi:hypothetical protein